MEYGKKGVFLFSRILCGNVRGVVPDIVAVEVDVQNGLPGFDMGGILAAEVRESKERVRVALKNSGLNPRPRRVTVNISPANMPKQGTGYDLAIAVGTLCAEDMFDSTSVNDMMIMGELSLDGSVRAVRGILPCVLEARRRGLKRCIIPSDNMPECRVVDGIDILGADSLKAVIDYLSGDYKALHKGEYVPYNSTAAEAGYDDYSDVCGQEAAVRASLIAAAGMHNILYMGAPGSGKTMMARRIAGILPGLTEEESLEVTQIYSIAGLLDSSEGLITQPPYRSPHHTITTVGLIGGGSRLSPGEITLAGHGVLFLDELTEFRSATLDAMRQPLEDGEVVIVRNSGTYRFPARFMLVAAMNPCKCGFYPDRSRCTCTEAQILNYRARISRPLLDRFDMCVHVSPVRHEAITLNNNSRGRSDSGNVWRGHNCVMSSEDMRERVIQARQIQGQRGVLNSQLTAGELERYCGLGSEERELAGRIWDKMGLTARGYYRILRVARTIADLEGSSSVRCPHIGEAVAYRNG